LAVISGVLILLPGHEGSGFAPPHVPVMTTCHYRPQMTGSTNNRSKHLKQRAKQTFSFYKLIILQFF
jgi:hypothetical protein